MLRPRSTTSVLWGRSRASTIGPRQIVSYVPSLNRPCYFSFGRMAVLRPKVLTRRSCSNGSTPSTTTPISPHCTGISRRSDGTVCGLGERV
jgi:hypothetical protein